MGWEKGKYYTRSRRVNGRVVREYVGCGKVAELVATLAELEREERKTEIAERQAMKADLAETTHALGELKTLCTLLTHAALLAAGYRQHKGEWRKQREASNTNPSE